MKQALCAAMLIVAACAQPDAPQIPGADVIGPPEAAGDHCPREAVNRFAQRWFRVADLDQGTECTGFIEQDECVIALFRDCTDVVSDIPRSWQGSIDKSKRITLARTTESSAAVIPRSPTECNGDLQTEATEPIGTWAKLDCKITMGAHGGFYFERIEDSIQPFATIDDDMRIDVLRDPPSDDQVPDFAVLNGRGELWALVATGNQLGGLYTGPVGGNRLLQTTAISFRRPRRMIISPDESFALISEGSSLLRLDIATTSTTTVHQGGNVEDFELLDNGVLIAVATGVENAEKTELRLLDRTTLAQLPQTPREILGDVDDIVPFEEDGTRAIAVLVFHDDMAVKLIDATFADVLTPDLLPEIPARAISLPGRQAVAFSGRSSPSLFMLRVTDGTVAPKIKVPGGEIESLFFSEKMGRLLIATDTRALIPYDVEFDRPLLQQILETDFSADLIRADSMGRMFSLSMEKGVIDPLLQ